ncbi:hypothetical protein Ciccas_012858, partial [Cichlidogyrus casuarinus]
DCDGDTPLHDAIAVQASLDMIKVLLRYHSDLTISNNAGQNPIHHAALRGDP